MYFSENGKESETSDTNFIIYNFNRENIMSTDNWQNILFTIFSKMSLAYSEPSQVWKLESFFLYS